MLVNAFVGAMVGLERSVLPALAEEEFALAAKLAMLSFILVFGLSKAAANLLAGRLADRWGRRRVLLAGWWAAAPVPFLLAWAPSWEWILGANALLGLSQGLSWSAAVIMKIDLAGPRRRGLAMGLNELSGYLAVAGSAALTGWLAVEHGLRPAPFLVGGVYVALGLGLSALFVRETQGFAQAEAAPAPSLSGWEVLRRASWQDRELSSASWAGMVNNLNDGLAWGLFPLLFAAAGLGLREIGWLAALYPAVWGLGQLLAGAASDRMGRKGLIVGGLLVQALGLGVVASGQGLADFVAGQVLLGLGTAMVYPTLLAAVGDVAAPSWRGSAVGVYRLWRDLGYAVGALLAGLVADALGLSAATWAVAALTGGVGLVAGLRMRETLRPAASEQAAQALGEAAHAQA
ncbi:MAG: MFS transporter [Alphaproteobacteria bacterium]|nr:MFS transporter [Alphaproteobacteria bacterium]MCB9793414.1 MFS transporter [Alphaproteobacteria bacterium]